MIISFLRQNRIYLILIEIWRRLYCFIIPVIAAIVYIILFYKYDIKIYKSKDFSNTLTSIITFVSIIISFFGVLLTMLISIKETSELVRYFLKSIDKEDFIFSIKRLVMCGLFAVIMAIILFLRDILPEQFIFIITIFTVYSLIRFTTLTYRFTNILLSLFINDKSRYNKPEGKKISKAEKEELDKALER